MVAARVLCPVPDPHGPPSPPHRPQLTQNLLRPHGRAHPLCSSFSSHSTHPQAPPVLAWDSPPTHPSPGNPASCLEEVLTTHLTGPGCPRVPLPTQPWACRLAPLPPACPLRATLSELQLLLCPSSENSSNQEAPAGLARLILPSPLPWSPPRCPGPLPAPHVRPQAGILQPYSSR